MCVSVWGGGGGGGGQGTGAGLVFPASVLFWQSAWLSSTSLCFIASFGSLCGLPAFSSVPAKSVLSCYLRGLFNETVTRISA